MIETPPEKSDGKSDLCDAETTSLRPGKDRLREKLIFIQREKLTSLHEFTAQVRAFEQREEKIFGELIDLLDSVENLVHPFQNKKSRMSASLAALLKSVERVRKKCLRLLEGHGVTPIDFPDGRAVVGLSKVVESEPRAALLPGTILTVVRTGYRRGENVLRPAELITSR